MIKGFKEWDMCCPNCEIGDCEEQNQYSVQGMNTTFEMKCLDCNHEFTLKSITVINVVKPKVDKIMEEISKDENLCIIREALTNYFEGDE